MANEWNDEFKHLISEIAKQAHKGNLIEQLQAFQKLDRFAKEMRKTHDFHGSDRWTTLCIIGSTLLYKIREELFEEKVIDGLKLNSKLMELYRDIRDLNSKNSTIVAINETFQDLSEKRDDRWVESFLDKMREDPDLFQVAVDSFSDSVTHPIVWYALIQTIRPPIVGRTVLAQVKHLFGDLRNMFGLEQYRYVAITARTILEYLLADRLGRFTKKTKVPELEERRNPDNLLYNMINDYRNHIANRKHLRPDERNRLKELREAMMSIKDLGNEAVHATIGGQDKLFSRSDAKRVMESLLIVVEGLYSDRGF